MQDLQGVAAEVHKELVADMVIDMLEESVAGAVEVDCTVDKEAAGHSSVGLYLQLKYDKPVGSH